MAKMTLHIGANISGLKSALGRAKSAITGFAGAIGAGLSAAGLVMFVKSAIDAADAVADGSKRIAISAEAYQKISYAAKQSGTDMGSVESAFKKMSATVEDASSGNKMAQETIAKLGISMDELKGKSPEQLFELMADALNQVSDETQKAALAQEVFGKGGMQLIPMLGSYKELGQEIADTGGIMSNEAVAAADAFNDSMERLKTTLMSGLVNSGFINWLNDVVKAFDEVSKAGGAFKIVAEDLANISGEESFSNILDDEIRSRNKKKQMGVKGSDKELEKAVKERNEKQKSKIDRAAKAEEFKKMQEVNKELEKYGKEQKKLEAEGIKEEQSISESIKALQEKIDVQKLINAGKEKEAAIQEAINAAENKAGRKLSDVSYDGGPSELEKVKSLAGESFDLSKKVTTTLPDAPVITDAVKRIGGSIGGANSAVGNAQLETQKSILGKLTEVSNAMGGLANMGGNSWA